MKIRYAAPAKQDLIEIQDYIAKDDKAAAQIASRNVSRTTSAGSRSIRNSGVPARSKARVN